ncbi:hypothetical protein LCGC14_1333210 [marine sediment metagenome]|uniref:Transcription factor CBF/NF-Y/archaeal histone domain-containing protein n=1 Tax=marine sediment metagenome TaxID=412755 RepID=A0A0F9NID7_9ZZZZ
MSKEKPTAKQMQQSLKAWMTDEDNKPHRLISASKIKDLAKAMDPDIRMPKDLHVALCREIAMTLKKAMLRCYDNKRATLRPLDL